MEKNAPEKSISFFHRGKKSQAAVEFALAFPIFLIIVFGIIDFALLFSAWLSVQNIARQAVRYAATGQYDKVKYCADDSLNADLPANGGDGEGNCFEGTNKNKEIDYARLKSTYDEAEKFASYFIFKDSTLVPWLDFTKKGYINITVCSTRDASDPSDGPDYQYNFPKMGDISEGAYGKCMLVSDGSMAEDAGGPGDRVIVGVDFNHPFLTPFINSAWEY
ncbi:MAG: TadE/TadG family type IV pilus assembly protein [Chloroflexota bacterium]